MPPSKANATRARNSQSSTGPCTEAGKARSSRNALKHGLRAEKLALAHEDPAELKDREDRWNEQFRPKDYLEYALVQTVVRAHLQMDRCAQHQRATLDSQLRGRTHRATMKVEDQVHEAHRILQEDPSRGQRELRRTGMGCGFLIGQWTLLRAQLERDGYFGRDDLAYARRLGGTFAQGQALVGEAPHPGREAAMAAAFKEIQMQLDELIGRERKIREWIEEPDHDESAYRELIPTDPAMGALCLRYLNAAHSVFFRAVSKLQQVQGERAGRKDDGTPCYDAPNEPEAPEPGPQVPDDPKPCAGPEAPKPASSGGSWLAPDSSSYWANESAESLNERLEILYPKKPSQVAQGDARRIGDR